MKDRDDREEVTKLIAGAYDRSAQPPPGLDEVLKEMQEHIDGVPDDETTEAVRALKTQLFPPPDPLGDLISLRIDELDLDETETASATNLPVDVLDKLQRGTADLARVDPAGLGQFLAALGFRFDDVRRSIEALAREHLKVRLLAESAVFGRTRKHVRGHQRRDDLLRGLGKPDEAASRNAVKQYLLAVSKEMEESEH